jgi:hypothetical protein
LAFVIHGNRQVIYFRLVPLPSSAQRMQLLHPRRNDTGVVCRLDLGTIVLSRELISLLKKSADLVRLLVREHHFLSTVR